MAENFQTAYEALMDTVNRPLSDTSVLAGAKREINNAILVLQRNHAYRYTEKLATFTYPASTLFVDLATICSGPLRDLMSVQQVASGAMQGKPLKLISYDQLQRIRNKYARTHSTGCDPLSPATLTGFTIEDAYRTDLISFLSGQSFGLYPTPGQDVDIMLNCHIWLPKLNLDSDTNFFLDYAFDVVQMIALKKMHIYLKNDSRYQITEQEFNDALASLITWDGQVMQNPFTTIQ